MEMNNTLQAPAARQNNGVVEYESNGIRIELSPATIKNYLIQGGGVPTDQELMMALGICRAQELNPFIREVHFIKYGSQPLAVVIGKDAYLKRAQKDPNFDGFQAGIIILNGDGEVVEREGAFYLKDREMLVGGWATVYRKNQRIPIKKTVALDEYIGRKKDGSVNSQWATKAATMIQKVATVQAIRDAFPNSIGGLYAQEEMAEVSGLSLDETPVQMPAAGPEPAVYEQAAFFPENAPEQALFS